jgi:hypothetical protein
MRPARRDGRSDVAWLIKWAVFAVAVAVAVAVATIEVTST